MTKKQWKKIIAINLLTVLVVLSPFLPGPNFMSRPTNLIFSFAQLGSIFGIIIIPVGLIWTIIQATEKQKVNKKILPVLLFTVPTISIVLSVWGADMARDISRTIAIHNAEKLILAIEEYKETNKHYPSDISQLKPDYIKNVPSPWIMGIPGYNYEKNQNSFNITFNQNVLIGFNFEVVVYDPTENHKADGELKTLYDTGKKGWKYYIYD